MILARGGASTRRGERWQRRARNEEESRGPRKRTGKRTRDLALFNLAIDSKLRGCDLVALRVDDVAPNGYAVDRATVRQPHRGMCARSCRSRASTRDQQ
jgi:hypothetical protein